MKLVHRITLLGFFILLIPPPLKAQRQDSSASIIVERMGGQLNTGSQDYGPMVTPDGATLYFVSDRSPGAGGHDIWMATRGGDGTFSTARNIGTPINSTASEGSMVVTADGLVAYFVSCDRGDGQGNCDIYSARREGGAWTDIRNVAALNSPGWEAQLTITPDGKTIYFVSDRAGNGSADIYVAHTDDEGVWSAPVKLGAPINSSSMQSAPFIAPGNVLYFSSDRPGGFGGYDFYASRLGNDGVWSTPRNLGAPINSAKDERFLSLPTANDRLYFSSNRPRAPLSTTDLDLYMVKLQQPPATIIVSGKVYDRVTLSPARASIDFIDFETRTTIASIESDEQTGHYSIALTGGPPRSIMVFASNTPYGSATTWLDLPPTEEYREIQYDIDLERLVGVGVKEEREEHNARLTIYPNPAAGRVTIECPGMKKGTVTVSDLYGNERAAVAIGDGRGTLDVSGFPAGIYLARIGEKGVPFVVQR
jgi:hypothetical protein